MTAEIPNHYTDTSIERTTSMTTQPSAFSTPPAEVVEQIVTDLVDLDANRASYPTIAYFLKEDEWVTIQAATRILQGVLRTREHAMATSLNTHWAYLVRSEGESFAETHDVTFDEPVEAQ